MFLRLTIRGFDAFAIKGQTVLRYIHMKSGHYSIPRALTPSL